MPHLKSYTVSLEIAGPTAMWTRPDTGAAPVSSVVPSVSAVKGIFESVLRWKSVNLRPTKVEICRPVQFHHYATNYGGPLRKSESIRNGTSFQQHAIVLVNVCYRIYAEIDHVAHYNGTRRADGSLDKHGMTTCPQHAFADAFSRTLRNGRYWSIPCLGWKEFVPDYVGNFRPITQICETENHIVPTLLHSVFDKPQFGKINPQFNRNLEVKKGVMLYA
jgi:CRISPR-associated protein Cas5d